MTESRMNPDELASLLKRLYDALDNGQAAGTLFGLLYARHLEAGSPDRSPNGIAVRAGLTCGPNVNAGFRAARYVRVELRKEYAELFGGQRHGAPRPERGRRG